MVDNASALADRMQRLIARLERDGVDTSINELGEVQGFGPDVDRLCARLHATRGKRDLVRRIAPVSAEKR